MLSLTPCVCALVVALSLAMNASAAEPASPAAFTVDAARPSGPPLLKTKFGVYQTPLVTLKRLLDSLPLLDEIAVQNLRYEIGWGKPDVLAHDMIGGTPERLTWDWSALDAFTDGLRAQDVRPLFAVTYCPNPLKSRTDWEAWKDPPRDMAAWRALNRDFARHLRDHQRLHGPFLEVWNEPDLDHTFFSGSPADYARLYAPAASGLREGDPDAPIGGPALAWNLAFLDAIRDHPLDFVSIHAYQNYASQLATMRRAVAGRPDLPILLTEYASYTEFPPNGPQSRHGAAMRFFRDAKALLEYPDVPKVYWAQWLDAGDGPGMGLVTYTGHRTALFNAFKLYALMPTDRSAVSSPAADGIGAMASADGQTVAAVFWNETAEERSLTVRIAPPARPGETLLAYRIDRDHASYVDNPASENLVAVKADDPSAWAGTLPPEGVLLLCRAPATPAAAPKIRPVGTLVRTRHWYPDRAAPAWADYDPRASVVRLGMGDRDRGLAALAVTLDDPAPRFTVTVERSDAPKASSPKAFTPPGAAERSGKSAASTPLAGLLALRVEFPAAQGGGGVKSVLFHDRDAPPSGDLVAAWAEGVSPERHPRPELSRGGAWTVDLKRLAPQGWDGRRVTLAFFLRDAGQGTRVRLTLARR